MCARRRAKGMLRQHQISRTPVSWILAKLGRPQCTTIRTLMERRALEKKELAAVVQPVAGSQALAAPALVGVLELALAPMVLPQVAL